MIEVILLGLLYIAAQAVAAAFGLATGYVLAKKLYKF